MIKGVLIDLGKTIVTNRIIDFEKAILSIYQETNKTITSEDFLKIHYKLYEITFKYLRSINNEMKITEYINSLLDITNLKTTKTIEELEDIFQKNLVDEELVDGVIELLQYFNFCKIPVIAVSNSCVSSRALMKELEELNVLKYFKKVISSADIYIRKPKKEIFDYALGQLKKITSDYTIKNDEVLFIGNDYQCDVIGGKNASLISVWFNQEQNEDVYNLCDINVNNYKELINILMNN